MIRTLCVMTAPRGDARRFGISYAADFCITRHFLRLTSSPSFFQIAGKCLAALRWLPYLSARSSPPPTGAAFTGTPFVTSVIKSLIVPKPFRSPKYRCILSGSTGGATRDPLRALATTPTVPGCCLVEVVQMSASLYSTTCRLRASRSALPSFCFSACHSFTRSSARGRLGDSPSGSHERADLLPARDSTGTNMYWATRGRRGSTRPCSAGH